jgi:hypothetical protein
LCISNEDKPITTDNLILYKSAKSLVLDGQLVNPYRSMGEVRHRENVIVGGECRATCGFPSSDHLWVLYAAHVPAHIFYPSYKSLSLYVYNPRFVQKSSWDEMLRLDKGGVIKVHGCGPLLGGKLASRQRVLSGRALLSSLLPRLGGRSAIRKLGPLIRNVLEFM